MANEAPDWLQKIHQIDTDNIIWLQRNAAYLYRMADKCRAVPCNARLASKVQISAADSAKSARLGMGLEG